MSNKWAITKSQADKAVKKHGSVRAAALALNIPVSTFRDIVHRPDTTKSEHKATKVTKEELSANSYLL